MAAPEAFSTQSSVTHRLSSAPLPSQSPDIILHSHNNSLSLSHQTHTRSIFTMCHRHRVRVAQKHTHTVSPQCSLINEMVCSLPQAWTNQHEDTNLSPLVMLKATGHYLLAISALTTQTERATRLSQEDTTTMSSSVCVFLELQLNSA